MLARYALYGVLTQIENNDNAADRCPIEVRCSLLPQKQTFATVIEMSALCQKRTFQCLAERPKRGQNSLDPGSVRTAG